MTEEKLSVVDYHKEEFADTRSLPCFLQWLAEVKGGIEFKQIPAENSAMHNGLQMVVWMPDPNGPDGTKCGVALDLQTEFRTRNNDAFWNTVLRPIAIALYRKLNPYPMETDFASNPLSNTAK